MKLLDMSTTIDLSHSQETGIAKPRWFGRVIVADRLAPDAADDYRALAAEHGYPHELEVALLKRRGQLITTLPSFAWSGTLEPKSIVDELAWRQAFIGYRQRGLGFHPERDVVHKEGRYYYRDNALSAVKPALKVPLIADALIRFLHAAEDPKSGLVRSNPYPSEPQYKAPEERVIGATLRRHRGPTWTEAEDYVIRKWFSRHTSGPHAGRHAPLTETQWNNVLLELGGRRAKSEVLSRIRVLNYELKKSLMIDGMISRIGVQTYMRQALGEHEPHPPRHRPRIKGRSYWAG